MDNVKRNVNLSTFINVSENKQLLEARFNINNDPIKLSLTKKTNFLRQKKSLLVKRGTHKKTKNKK